MRRLLACVLSLGLVVQGYASVRAMDAGCPMRAAAAAGSEAGMHHDMAGAQPHADDAANAGGAAHEDDCGDSGAAARHCGCVTGCQPASASMAPPLLPAALQWVLQPPARDAPAFRSHQSLRHWRPPAQT